MHRWISPVDFPTWEAVGTDLCRLAKQFKIAHPGRKMEVEVSGGSCFGDNKLALVEWFRSGEIMLKLKEYANVVITE